MDMLGTSLGHTSLSLGGLGDLGLDSHHSGLSHHEHHHPHQPLPPHRPLSPPVLPSHSHSLSSSSAVDSSFSPGSSSHLPSSTVKIKPGEYFDTFFKDRELRDGIMNLFVVDWKYVSVLSLCPSGRQNLKSYRKFLSVNSILIRVKYLAYLIH